MRDELLARRLEKLVRRRLEDRVSRSFLERLLAQTDRLAEGHLSGLDKTWALVGALVNQKLADELYYELRNVALRVLPAGRRNQESLVERSTGR